MDIYILLFYILVSTFLIGFLIFVHSFVKLTNWLVNNKGILPVPKVSKYSNSSTTQEQAVVKEVALDLDTINAQLDLKRADRIMTMSKSDTQVSEGAMCASTIIEQDSSEKEAINNIRKNRKG